MVLKIVNRKSKRGVNLEDEKPRDECGVFGIIAPGRSVSRLIHFGLFALQHRGQESAGIATWDGLDLHLRKAMGLVSDVFDDRTLQGLSGDMGIGHVRYSTTGSSNSSNASPFVAYSGNGLGFIVVAHNGNIVNAGELRQTVLENGARLIGTTDSEVISHVLAQAEGDTWVEKIINGAKQLRGAFSLAILTKDGVYALRDPFGVRPLSIGQMNDGGGWVVSSETCALDLVGATLEREVNPGELLKLDAYAAPELVGVVPAWYAPEHKAALCAAELFYIARPDSIIANSSVYQVREELGRWLARENPVEADLVIGVPDSGIPAATGYAQESGIPFREGLVKNRYIGRTFIQPDPQLRRRSVMLKLNPLRPVLEGKRVVVIDDSIVRGNTFKAIVHLLRTVGRASEVHLRISAPPVRHPCVLGVDTGTYEELIANHKSIEDIREYMDADSLGFLSEENFVKASRLGKDKLCLACFNGRYPVDFKYTPGGAKFALEKAK
jgi:amidophosphoribosyltransferase